MSLSVSPAILRIEAPPISEAMAWVKPGERNRTLLNLCQAVPSYAPADALKGEIARLARDPEIHLYTDIHGIPELRNALAQHMAADYHGQINAENVSITSGCNQAFCAAPVPKHHLPAALAGSCRQQRNQLPLISRRGYRPSEESLSSAEGAFHIVSSARPRTY